MDDNGDTRLLTRIQKLFALAEGTKHQDEAESAMLKAQMMLAENGWSMSDLPEFTCQKTVIEGAFDSNGKPIHNWQHLIVCVITPNFRVTPILRRGWGTKHPHLVYIGLRDDVNVAMEVTNFAFRWFEKNWKIYLATWKKENKDVWLYCDGGTNTSRTRRMKNSYALGFRDGLNDKFQRQVEEHALVLVQDALVKQHLSEMRITKGSPMQMSTGSSWSNEAFSTGRRDGKRFHTGNERSMLT